MHITQSAYTHSSTKNMQGTAELTGGASAASNDYTVLRGRIKPGAVQAGTTSHPLNGQREIQRQEYVIHLNWLVVRFGILRHTHTHTQGL